MKRILVLKRQLQQSLLACELVKTEIIVCGGSSIDIISKTQKLAVAGNSNIGSISMKYGGTSRNVVEGLARLGQKAKTLFITAIGTNQFGNILIHNLRELGVRPEGIFRTDDFPTGTFNATLDDKGEMMIAVADTIINTKIPESHY